MVWNLRNAAMAALFGVVLVTGVHSQIVPGADRAGAIGRAIETELWTQFRLPYLGIVVVHGDRIAYISGQGHQDVENGIAFDPELTVFRAASMAKLPTALAATEILGNRGIDLNEPVMRYLPSVTVLVQQRTPIRFEHLLYHTDAIEARSVDTKTLDSDRILPLREFLSNERIVTFDRPGLMITYGNWAGALLGATIEELVDLDFGSAMMERFLRPAGMHSTSYLQPPPEPLEQRLAGEYRYRNDQLYRLPPSYSRLVPAGGMYTTVADMGRLIRLLHGGGVIDGRRVLSESTVKLAVSTGFRSHPMLPGVTVGFFEEKLGGVRLLVRDGDSTGVFSRMMMAPDHDIGVFLTTATNDPAPRLAAARVLVEAIRSADDRADPQDPPHGALPGTPPARGLTAYAGLYSFVQRPRHDISRLPMQLATLLRIKTAGDGAIRLLPGAEEPFGRLAGPTIFHPAGAELFESDGGQIQIAFRRGPLGEVRHLFSGSGYHGSYEKLRPWERLYFALVGLVVPTLFCILETVRRAWRAIRRRPVAVDTRSRRQSAGLTVFAACISAFAVTALPSIALVGMSPGLPAWVLGLHPLAYAVFALPMIALAAVMVTLALGMRGTATGLTVLVPAGIMDRVLLGVAPVLFISLYHWRLLGYWF